MGAFLDDTGGVARSEALYVIEMGSNDLRDALVAFSAGEDGGPILEAAALSIAQTVATLYASGARHFLVWSVPDPGLTPALRMLDILQPGTAAFASQLAQEFNVGLDAALALLSALPGIEIARLDAFALIHTIVADPAAFGFTNWTSACITPGVAPFTCRQADEFVFWDGIHPTTHVHQIIAQEAATVLGVP
jgi:outer membrane lipase/esterase